MDAAVVDCSALAAIVFHEELAAKVLPQLQQRRLIAPVLLPFELAQVCTVKKQRYPAQGAMLHEQFVAALNTFGMVLEPVGFDELPALAAQFKLSCYDAAYLWLALAHGVPLVTLDDRLADAHAKALASGV